jgi:peptidoglycan/xylan/chitin deacetylase (PgdA/CDA1 family)
MEQIDSTLFRPPHGQLYPWQMPKLKRLFSKVVMWDVLSKDYDNSLTASDVFENVKRHVRPGSIIVFHDSVKAWPRLKEALPATIDYLIKEGYSFRLL